MFFLHIAKKTIFYTKILTIFLYKEELQKKHVKDIKIFLKKKKAKSEKKPKKDIKTSLKKEMEKSVGIIVNVIKVFLSNKCRS